MSTTVELVRANERYARLRAAVGALADQWGDEDEQIAHVVACQDFGCGDCVVAACTSDLRALLAAVDS